MAAAAARRGCRFCGGRCSRTARSTAGAGTSRRSFALARTTSTPTTQTTSGAKRCDRTHEAAQRAVLSARGVGGWGAGGGAGGSGGVEAQGPLARGHGRRRHPRLLLPQRSPARPAPGRPSSPVNAHSIRVSSSKNSALTEEAGPRLCRGSSRTASTRTSWSSEGRVSLSPPSNTTRARSRPPRCAAMARARA